VPHELDHILISYTQPEFDRTLAKIRSEIVGAAIFAPGDERLVHLMKILQEVTEHGDEAVSEFTRKYDEVELSPEDFRVADKDIEKAHKETDKDLLDSIRRAINNVRKYQAEVFIGDKSTHPGMKYTPIRRVGVCVPGASAPLPSTVIMTVVPAQVAGVQEIVVVSPPRYNASIHPVTLAVCRELGIDEVYRIGGAQAVAALAFGTSTIGPVNKIAGPGGQWVQMAKLQVFGFVGIDTVAGPSEVLIIANDKANPTWVAADMLSQAEHAPGRASVFTDSQAFAEKVLDELKEQVTGLNRTEQTCECLKQYCAIAVFEKLDDAIDRASDFAAEHLQIQCGDQSRKIAAKIENAGAMFIGDYSPVAVGDYWAGPSHTLPTGTSAKFFSALSANDFIKSTSIIEYDKQKLAESADHIIRLAEIEGLDAHAKSIRIRQQQ
jgi:histidinol dehydrogenase